MPRFPLCCRPAVAFAALACLACFAATPLRAAEPVSDSASPAVTAQAAPAQSAEAKAATITWRTDVREALEQARQQKRPVLMKFTASWCVYCHKMKRETFSDPRIVEQVNACFIPVLVDADKYEKVVEALDLPGLPATLVINADLDIVETIVGYKTADQLTGQLTTICRNEGFGKTVNISAEPAERN